MSTFDIRRIPTGYAWAALGALVLAVLSATLRGPGSLHVISNAVSLATNTANGVQSNDEAGQISNAIRNLLQPVKYMVLALCPVSLVVAGGMCACGSRRWLNVFMGSIGGLMLVGLSQQIVG